MDPTKRPLSLLSSQKRSWSPHGASWSSDNLVFVLWFANGIQNILISALMKSQLVLVLFYYMLTGCERPFLIFQQSRLPYIFFVALFIYSVSKKCFLTTVPAGSGIWRCATHKQRRLVCYCSMDTGRGRETGSWVGAKDLMSHGTASNTNSSSPCPASPLVEPWVARGCLPKQWVARRGPGAGQPTVL